jgi:hypothetical protein
MAHLTSERVAPAAKNRQRGGPSGVLCNRPAPISPAAAPAPGHYANGGRPNPTHLRATATRRATRARGRGAAETLGLPSYRGRVWFDREIQLAHRRFRQSVPAFIGHGSFLNLLTAPLIYTALVPLLSTLTPSLRHTRDITRSSTTAIQRGTGVDCPNCVDRCTASAGAHQSTRSGFHTHRITARTALSDVR